MYLVDNVEVKGEDKKDGVPTNEVKGTEQELALDEDLDATQEMIKFEDINEVRKFLKGK